MANGSWVHNRAIQTFEKDGLRYASGLVTDITQRKAAEESLRESEQRYRLLFERNLAGVFRCSQVGSFLDCNDAGAKILGYDSREDLIGRSVMDVFFDPADKTPQTREWPSTELLPTRSCSCVARTEVQSG